MTGSYNTRQNVTRHVTGYNELKYEIKMLVFYFVVVGFRYFVGMYVWIFEFMNAIS